MPNGPDGTRSHDSKLNHPAPVAFTFHEPLASCEGIWTHCAEEKENFWPLHRRPFVQCVIPSDGARCDLVWRAKDGTQECRSLKPGEVWLLPTGAEQEIHWRRRAKVIVLFGNHSLVPEIAGVELEISSIRPLAEYSDQDPMIGILAASLFTLAAKRDPRDRRLIAAKGAALFLAVIRAHLKDVRAGDGVGLGQQHTIMRQRVDRYIQAHLSEPFSLSKLAAAAHMSRWHFCRVFKQETTMTPRDYFNRCRVIRAHALLATGKLTQTQVMHELGFTEHGHFRRVFKKHLHVMPRQVAPRIKTQ